MILSGAVNRFARCKETVGIAKREVSVTDGFFVIAVGGFPWTIIIDTFLVVFVGFAVVVNERLHSLILGRPATGKSLISRSLFSFRHSSYDRLRLNGSPS